MSWCRWSSMDFQCDLYVYDSHAGTEVHVGANRYELNPEDSVPPPVDIIEDFDGWYARHEMVNKMIQSATVKPIGLPHDGETRVFDSLEEAADWIDELVALGYRVPDEMTDEMRGYPE